MGVLVVSFFEETFSNSDTSMAIKDNSLMLYFGTPDPGSGQLPQETEKIVRR